MQGSLIVLGITALAAALLLAPIRIKLTAALGIYGGYCEIRISCLCFGVLVPIRLHLLGDTKPQLRILRRDGSVRKRVPLIGTKKPPSRWDVSLRAAAEIRQASAVCIIGLADAPAFTALLCGFVEGVTPGVLRIFLPGTDMHVRAIPAYTQDTFRVNMEGIASFRVGKLIKCRLQKRGE